MSFSIRRATAEDASALARLRYEFRSSHREPSESSDEFTRRCAEWMSARLGDEGAWSCWVAEGEGQLVGCVWLQLVEKIPNPSDIEHERHAYLTNFYVVESARGGGLGARLLSTALDFCAERGVDAVFLWPTERSRTLYLRHGFNRPESLLEQHLA